MKKLKSCQVGSSRKISVDYLAKDKKNIKTEKFYQVASEQLAQAEISARAKKRLMLRDYLLEHPGNRKIGRLVPALFT